MILLLKPQCCSHLDKRQLALLVPYSVLCFKCVKCNKLIITFTQIQDSKYSATPCLPQVIVGDAGVEASITGFAIPNPEPSVLLVLHVDKVIIVVPVQGGLGVSSHCYLETDVTACPHGGVPHFAYKNRWSWGGMTGSSRFRDNLILARFGPLWGDDGARGCHCFICPFFQGHLHLSFSHGCTDMVDPAMDSVTVYMDCMSITMTGPSLNTLNQNPEGIRVYEQASHINHH